jgi:hypothetical protein
MITQVEHSETWTLTITPDTDTWPPVDMPYSSAGRQIQPDKIGCTLNRGSRPHIWADGYRILRSGLGKERGTVRMWKENDTPGWVAELVEQARRQHDLGPSRTGVDW